jgi:hypothetical protein
MARLADKQARVGYLGSDSRLLLRVAALASLFKTAQEGGITVGIVAKRTCGEFRRRSL